MGLKRRQRNITAIILICLMTFLFTACTSSENAKDTEIIIDWGEVNKALNEKGYYPQSIEEAEIIAGYKVPTIINNLPPGFNDNFYIFIIKQNPLKEDSHLSVMQSWSYDDGQASFPVFFETLVSTEQFTLGKHREERSEVVQINNLEVQILIPNGSDVITLIWHDGKINYCLYGKITEQLTENKYLEIAKLLIDQLE